MLIPHCKIRYYGETLPFGDRSFDKDKVGFLTSEQALADYADLIPYLKVCAFNIKCHRENATY